VLSCFLLPLVTGESPGTGMDESSSRSVDPLHSSVVNYIIFCSSCSVATGGRVLVSRRLKKHYRLQTMQTVGKSWCDVLIVTYYTADSRVCMYILPTTQRCHVELLCRTTFLFESASVCEDKYKQVAKCVRSSMISDNTLVVVWFEKDLKIA
jgi:hypothetical protein